MSSNQESTPNPPPRRRLSREQRLQQLMAVAWRIVREHGTEALTLGYLAEQAGVTKPVVYDHFATRAVLLIALYQDFDQRQTLQMDQALERSEPLLAHRARVIASSYVDCVLLQGREIPGVIAALASSPELEAVKLQYQQVFLDKCRSNLQPFAEGAIISAAALRAMLGAAEAVSHAAALGDITPAQAQDELYANIVAMVERARANESISRRGAIE
ncbi:TetR/AcrR family transcriptional regulator [Pseudomonas sessilinigenes]|uniref:TetR/AcrR family transcriptional regulator n=2 Tax=Pseudomonas sessilinigenes TaxID=658629 RepID=A0ABX8ML22_9PSED|nr:MULTISPECIES: TetR/AcrR family transcriptional regulator [Pseudomonas]QXH38998.1 TetR/AcrR family transcriptional regulator [Pseudomonas sessilinigenes]UMZ09456.1 TetR/AcrR family transcriptional regulator [Pseudomonas sp. MPFS]